MPLDASDEHDAVGIVGGFIEEDIDAVGRAADLEHFKLADDGTAHRGFGDVVLAEDHRLAFGRGGAVAAHGGEDEGLHAGGLPEVNDRADDGLDVGDAARANANGDPRAGGELGGELGALELRSDGSGDVRNGAVREVLADGQHPG